MKNNPATAQTADKTDLPTTTASPVASEAGVLVMCAYLM